ncbi:MAG: ATP-binding protein [Chlorobiaceae bacterium]|nr:ATP-binding protein [Chlorobiaceae bacterium]
MTSSEKNALAVSQYLNFLADIFRQRINHTFDPASPSPILSDVRKIVSVKDDSELSVFIRANHLSPEEIVVLLLAFVPHVQPEFFDSVINQQLSQSGDFPQIGGTRGKQSRGFLPTGETALFILAGNNLHKRFDSLALFGSEHFFARKNLIWLDQPEAGEPPLSGKLMMAGDYLELFVHGKFLRPQISMDFPAEYITTELTENDLVLPEQTINELKELENWIRYHDVMMEQWSMKRWLKPGYRALFHGLPGTGKTLAAMILGKKTGREVFRIDLSMVVSKFIGETEKNLSQLFERAKSKEWILFFDEADALFGKRTNIRDAHDKYANQEVSYLLQRIENHDGLVILASNFKSNIDDAFIRRFQSVIYFPLPRPEERFSIWRKAFPVVKNLQIPDERQLMEIARKYEISGAGIVNVVQFCCIEALADNSMQITYERIKAGIEREFQKEGKVF